MAAGFLVADAGLMFCQDVARGQTRVVCFARRAGAVESKLRGRGITSLSAALTLGASLTRPEGPGRGRGG